MVLHLIILNLALIVSWLFVCLPPGQTPPAEKAMIRQGLVNVQQIDSTILVDLKYSTTDNFTGKDVYGDLTRAYLQPLAARKLALANAHLKQQHPHLRLLIYDATRPRSVQWNLWNALPQYSESVRRTYVADPRVGSIHNYGCAVDVTIATVASDPKKGTPLDLGTKFDYFGKLAYPTQEASLLKAGKLTRQQVSNRELLRSVMRRAGFTAIDYEWWHFNALSRARAKALFKIVE
ncbi:MAG: M15 family metallopeptidase [Bacteroidetes bacterium]|nr:M15 family metallopeptidase [Fibrella sp.]